MARRPKPFSPAQERLGTAVLRVGTPLNVWIYRVSRGRLGGRFPGGAPICLVTTRGRKTGRPRTVPLLYLVDGDDVVVVASKGGMSHHPDWYRNLVDDPRVRVEVAGETRDMIARTATTGEKTSLWPRLVTMYRAYDTYQARTDRDIPVVVCSPAPRA